jgi:hypothetical protein
VGCAILAGLARLVECAIRRRPAAVCEEPANSRQQFVQALLRDVGDAGEHVGKPGLRVDVIERATTKGACAGFLLLRLQRPQAELSWPKNCLFVSALQCSTGHSGPRLVDWSATDDRGDESR